MCMSPTLLGRRESMFSLVLTERIPSFCVGKRAKGLPISILVLLK